ncbi:hypothetical protein [Streptomyces sp. NPDC094149]|uniref:hypothetical protein n=1 Tax=Streptomyces sp. NPDC094149 TaxID=3155079 RepID=UPI00331B5A00
MLDPEAPEPVITRVLDLDRTLFGDPFADWTIRMASTKNDERTACGLPTVGPPDHQRFGVRPPLRQRRTVR